MFQNKDVFQNCLMNNDQGKRVKAGSMIYFEWTDVYNRESLALVIAKLSLCSATTQQPQLETKSGINLLTSSSSSSSKDYTRHNNGGYKVGWPFTLTFVRALGHGRHVLSINPTANLVCPRTFLCSGLSPITYYQSLFVLRGLLCWQTIKRT